MRGGPGAERASGGHPRRACWPRSGHSGLVRPHRRALGFGSVVAIDINNAHQMAVRVTDSASRGGIALLNPIDPCPADFNNDGGPIRWSPRRFQLVERSRSLGRLQRRRHGLFARHPGGPAWRMVAASCPAQFQLSTRSSYPQCEPKGLPSILLPTIIQLVRSQRCFCSLMEQGKAFDTWSTACSVARRRYHRFVPTAPRPQGRSMACTV